MPGAARGRSAMRMIEFHDTVFRRGRRESPSRPFGDASLREAGALSPGVKGRGPQALPPGKARHSVPSHRFSRGPLPRSGKRRAPPPRRKRPDGPGAGLLIRIIMEREEARGAWKACDKAVNAYEYQRLSVWAYCQSLRQQGRWLDYILERIRLRRIVRRKSL